MYDNNMEKHIMTLIKTYGSLPVKLVIELFKLDEKYINYLVSKMVRRKMLFYIGENNIGLYQGQKSDEKTIMALWFLSEYIRDIDCMNVYKAAMPFKVGFIMNKQLCKIAVPDEGDDIIFRIIALYEMVPKYQSTVGRGKRLLLTPDEVLRLPHDEMLVVIRGQNILKLKKLDYTKHPMSKQIIKTKISDYTPAPYRTYIPTPDDVSETGDLMDTHIVEVNNDNIFNI